MLVQPLAPTLTSPSARPQRCKSGRPKGASHSASRSASHSAQNGISNNVASWRYALTNRVQPFTGKSIFEISFTFVRRLDQPGCRLERVDVSKPKVSHREGVQDKENAHGHESEEREQMSAISALQKSVPFIYNTAMAALIRSGPFQVTDANDIMDATPDSTFQEIFLSHLSGEWPSQSIFASVVEALVSVPSIDNLFSRAAGDDTYIPMISCDLMTSHEHTSAAMRANILIMRTASIEPA